MTAETPAYSLVQSAPAHGVLTQEPMVVDGEGADAGDALTAKLETVAGKVRHHRYDDRYRSGRFATGNTASVKHGQRARLTLRKRKAARLEELRAFERPETGELSWRIDSLLAEVADLETHAATASEFLSRLWAQGLRPGDAQYDSASAVRLHYADRFSRAHRLLQDVRPAPMAAGAIPAFTVRRVSDGEAASEPAPVALPALEGSAEGSPAVEAVAATPARLVGHVAQWNGRVGSVRAETTGRVYVVRGEGLTLTLGQRVTFLPDGERAVDVKAEDAE